MIVVTTHARARLDVPKPFRIVQIGRSTPLGNPFRLDSEKNRLTVIAAYRQRLQAILEGAMVRPAVLQALRDLEMLVDRGENLALVCPGNCRPALPCHGDVLKEYLDQYATGEHR